MAKIHPTAIVEDGAVLGADVEIGPYAHIGADVKLGDGVSVAQGAIIDGHTTIGAKCQIFPYALIGMKTQDLKYREGSVSYVEIGERTVIREFATIQLGTADGEKTVIGCVANLTETGEESADAEVEHNVGGRLSVLDGP